ncbi:dihydrofolate reductase family protein [Oscillibacter sp.]|uniref:dihydrofolate reductase family protein n=1 Tax=Oscillibacter sp. TaxID=1945593 RepID=UPI00257FDBAA|nr:dihydrofolate reductase family protein [Oscillibacter sp.]
MAEVLALKDRPGKHIWLFGGGELASDFIRADAVDRYIVGILPVIRGKGRRLFQEGIPPVELHLDRCTVSDGIPILEYRAGPVDRQQPQGAFPAAVVL